MTIYSFIRRAQEIDTPPMTPAQAKKLGYAMIAAGYAIVAMGDGPGETMDDLCDAIERVIDDVEDVPGPDIAVKPIAKRRAKSAVLKRSKEMHRHA